jgi:two-component system chemotaxis sensor kinase CheA
VASAIDLTEQLAAAALLADPNDLPALANLHEKLAGVPRQIAGEPVLEAAVAQGVSTTATAACKLVEGIILRETNDANAAMEEVCRKIAEIQEWLTGAGGKSAEAAAKAMPRPESDAMPGPSSESPAASAGGGGGRGDGGRGGEPLPREEDLPMLAEFLSEAREHLATSEAALLILEECPGDAEQLNAIFRGFHTIKGVAGFLNLQQISKLAHAAETLLDLGRKGTLGIAGPVFEAVLQAADLARELLGEIDDAMRQNGTIPANGKLAAMIHRLEQAAKGELATVPLPGAASTAPSISEAPVNEPVTARTPMPQETPAVDAHEPAEPTAPAASASHPEAPSAPRAGGVAAPGGGGGAPAAEATVKVATARLDSLINMVGELVIAQAMVSQDMANSLSATAGGGGQMHEDQRIARNMSHLGKITRELQDLAMSMRMVPIQGVFQKMARLVRDLARKAGKEISLTIEGGETELDRNLVEAIADPLLHMVRNAADHGIEPADIRDKAGKPRAGTIILKAYHQAGCVVVEISDDGRGLNKARILQKARDAGLVREGQELSEAEIFNLIFAPGLSTAEKVTDVSGRGVGMDVVRRNVEALRGRIDIASAEGKGSTFTIRLPLTLAVIDGLVIKVGAARYILPITSIEQSLRPKREQLSTVWNKGEMCKVRDDLIPLFRLHELFNVQPKTTDPCEALLVLVQDGARRCCLLVDELLGQQQVVIKSLGEATEPIPGVSGGAILGDGTISLILDVPGLIDLVAVSPAAGTSH